MTVNEPKIISGPARKKPATPKKRTQNPTTPIKRRSESLHSPDIHANGTTNTVMDDAHESSAAFRARVTEITRFKVYSRVRPFIAEELADMEGQERRSIVEMTDNKTVILDPKDDWTPKAQFEFDGSLWSIPPEHRIVHTFQDTKRSTYATQKDVYEIIAKELVPHVFDGFNSCILTYGQTGSGKTYTMMGLYDPNASCGGDGEEGIIPRVSNDLFLILGEKQKEELKKEPHERVRFRVEVSFVEIYMERVRDLLDPALRNTKGNEKLQDARIRQDPYSGPFVEGVTKYQVENWAQCCLLLERGSRHRTTCATAIHNQSSRSHAIFQLTVIQELTIPAKDRYSRPVVRCQAGRINLVDLAGSERGGFQEYVKESAAINTSLLALRRVIDNLTERQNILMEQAKAVITGTYYQDRPLPQVPFRDSVLTWLLSDSIGGNARTTMVATLSPLVKNYGDTLATLQWSSKARNLVTLVKVNDAQTTVTGGMSNKAGELQNAVRIQRQNMDSLRETLRQKQELAERLEVESRNMTKQTGKNKELVKKIESERYAFTVLRALQRQVAVKKIRMLSDQYDKLKRQLAAQQNTMAEAEKRRERSAQDEAKLQKRLEKERHREEDLRIQVAEKESANENFNQEFEEVSEQYNTLIKEVESDESVQKALADINGKQREAQRRVDNSRNEAEELNKKAEMMETKIRESKQPNWRSKIQKDEEDAVELRRQRDELRRKFDELQAKRDELKTELDKRKKKR
ncbi:kinesin [Trypanosoma theileri]|uniref:Kinesin-like protein n=1 Tax=Trypanosoma theileri TaxID=67003 RepID=A0A1X0NWZ8_9TRYP|nr:kinesin [Trypanosoma theileri]ORC89236.1 kinesin [Trypanosoma theileri]